ncbi:MAG TPA: glycosyltransferase [Nitrososphaerales archaeon]|nr:glycosyltransferase [Nitrososphaerales archaeon]
MGKPRLCVAFGFPFGDGGGLDRAVSAVIYALDRADYDVELVTFGRPDIEAIKRLYGYELRVAKVVGDGLYYRLPRLLRLPVCTGIALYHTVKLSKSVRLFLFVGGRFQPTRFVPYRRQRAMCYQISPRWRPTGRIMAGEGGLFQKMYRILWDNTWPFPLGPRKDDFMIVHNSYARRMLEEEFGLEAKGVLSLPAPEEGRVEAKRRRKVVHFGRFHPEKGHMEALRIMGLVHAAVPDAEFVLMGLTNLPEISQPVLEELRAEVERLGMGGCTRILTDLPLGQALRELAESRVMLSMQRGPETYNMTIIEAMSQGCVPAVPRIPGGAWEDILDEGRYGYGFGTPEEGAEEVSRILRMRDSEFEAQSAKSLERADFFSLPRFVERLDGAIARFLRGSR